MVQREIMKMEGRDTARGPHADDRDFAPHARSAPMPNVLNWPSDTRARRRGRRRDEALDAQGHASGTPSHRCSACFVRCTHHSCVRRLRRDTPWYRRPRRCARSEAPEAFRSAGPVPTSQTVAKGGDGEKSASGLPEASLGRAKTASIQEIRLDARRWPASGGQPSGSQTGFCC